MEYEQVDKVTSYKFSNGWRVDISKDDITVWDQDQTIVITKTRDEFEELMQVLTEVSYLVNKEHLDGQE